MTLTASVVKYMITNRRFGDDINGSAVEYIVRTYRKIGNDINGLFNENPLPLNTCF